MNAAAMKHLVCPVSLQTLSLDAVEREADEVISGSLRTVDGRSYSIVGGIPDFVPAEVARTQTVRSFSQKWAHHSYYREHTRAFYTQWYLQRYGFLDTDELAAFLADKRTILDAGTGMGRDAANLAQHSRATVWAVDTAREALEAGLRDLQHPRVAFVRADLNRLPFPDDFFDFINCDQVIHHTPEPRETFENLGRKLKPGGEICCYVYKKKGPVREFTDDYVRGQIAALPVNEALKICEGITRLGRTLADVKVDVEIEEDIPLLGISKGKLDLQRFFHWNVMKCFWNEQFDFHTNNIINLDWYHPENCHRFEPEAFAEWFARGWDIQAWDVQDAGISCRARKV